MNRPTTGKPDILITAGTTREMIDKVRCWMNIFTGQTGLDIAKAFMPVANVTLLTSNPEHQREFQALVEASGANGCNCRGFESHQDLLGILESQVQQKAYDAVLMTAAVSDYQPDGAFEILSSSQLQGGGEVEYHWIVRRVDRAKIRSSHKQIAFRGKPTTKIVDLLRPEWGFGGLLVKFKLEVDVAEGELVKTANRSRLESGADLIVANTLEMVRGAAPEAWLIDDFNSRRVPRSGLAAELRDYVISRIRK